MLNKLEIINLLKESLTEYIYDLEHDKYNENRSEITAYVKVLNNDYLNSTNNDLDLNSAKELLCDLKNDIISI